MKESLGDKSAPALFRSVLGKEVTGVPLRKLYLELSDRCNLNCTICYRQSWQETPQDLDGALYARLLAEIKEMPALETIVLGGIGEPTCAPDFTRVIEDLQGYRLILTTNGVSLGDEILASLIGRVDSVVISIDGMAEIFEQIRGVPLKTVTDTVERLQALKREWKVNRPTVSLQCVLSEDNVSDALPLVDLAADLGVDSLVFSNLMPQTAANKGKILYTRYENTRMKVLYNQLQIRSFRRGLQLTLPNCELKTERRCSFIEEDAAFISAEGDVIPCYRLSHSYLEYVFGREKQVVKHSFGNLKEKGLQAVWDSSPYVKYREHVLHGRYPSCIDCDFVDGCEYVTDSTAECWGNTPSCADCLWSRRIVICP